MVDDARARYWDVDRCSWVLCEVRDLAPPDQPADGADGPPAGSPGDIPVPRSDVDATGAGAPAGPA